MEKGVYTKRRVKPVEGIISSSDERIQTDMWKPNQPGSNNPSTPEPSRPTPPAPTYEPPRAASPSTGSAPASGTGEQATIGKSLVVKGEVTGSESLYIDGKVEGAINLPGNRVTVGRNGQVAANIVAREVVVLGKVRGNCQASDRVDIRSEGSLTGDVIAARISIEDGAFFKGGIDIRKPGGTDLKGGPAQPALHPGAGRSSGLVLRLRTDRNGSDEGRGRSSLREIAYKREESSCRKGDRRGQPERAWTTALSS